MDEKQKAQYEKVLRNGLLTDAPYVFVSYASKDADKVYPTVLELRRRGYNIYIDSEFAGKLSEDWLGNLQTHLYTPSCTAIVAFLSIHYMRSYACLMEQLANYTKAMNLGAGAPRQLLLISLEGAIRSPQDMRTRIYDFAVSKASQSVLIEVQPNEVELMQKLVTTSTLPDAQDIVISDLRNQHHIATQMNNWLFNVIPQKPNIGAFGSVKDCVELLELNFKNDHLLQSNDDLIARYEKRMAKYPELLGGEASSAKKTTAAPAQPKAEPSAAPQKPKAPKKESVAPAKKTPVAPPQETPTQEGFPLYFRNEDHNALLVQDEARLYRLQSGALMKRKTNPSCQNTYTKQRDRILQSGAAVAEGDDYILVEEVSFTSLSAAASVLLGNSESGTRFWTSCEAPETVTAGDTAAAIATAEGSENASCPDGIRYRRKGRQSLPGLLVQRGPKEFILCAGNAIRKAPAPSFAATPYFPLYQKICATEALREEGEYYITLRDISFESFSAVASVVAAASRNGNQVWEACEEPVTAAPAAPKAAAGGITLADIRAAFAGDVAFCTAVRDLRKGTWGGRGAFDYAMAAVLGGCNDCSASYQKNYCECAVADPEKKTGGISAAAFSWQSNCRKLTGLPGSGKIDAEIDAHFAALREDTPLDEIIRRFEAADERFYQTAKNEQIVAFLRAVAALMNP